MRLSRKRPDRAFTSQLQRRTAGAVMVVVDGGASGSQALEWAAAEAAVRRRALRIVHVVPWLWTADPFGNLITSADEPAMRESAEAVVAEAVERARSVAPSLEVTTHLEATAPGAVAEAVTNETLIAIGRRLRGGWLGWLGRFAGSAAERVAQRTGVPVAVVGLTDQPSRGPSAGRVVVGVDGNAGPASVLGFALRAARRRGTGLTVLHAYDPRHLVTPDALDDALQAWRDAFSDVDVRREFVAATPAQALVAEASGAALVALGPTRHGRLRRILFGSVARDVVRSTSVPVAIVPAPSIS
jgi:nucleotide-binding universal stress UspA family protein